MKSIVVQMAQMRVSAACSEWTAVNEKTLMAQMRVSAACPERTAVNEKTLMAQTQIFVLARIVWKIVSVLLSELVRALMLWMMPPTERVFWTLVRTLFVIVPRILNWLRPCRCVLMPVRSTANPEIRLP